MRNRIPLLSLQTRMGLKYRLRMQRIGHICFFGAISNIMADFSIMYKYLFIKA